MKTEQLTVLVSTC